MGYRQKILKPESGMSFYISVLQLFPVLLPYQFTVKRSITQYKDWMGYGISQNFQISE